jgi:hypothetical protein
MAEKFNRPNHKIAIQLHIVAENCTSCSSFSRRPVRKLMDTPSYMAGSLSHSLSSALYHRLAYVRSLIAVFIINVIRLWCETILYTSRSVKTCESFRNTEILWWGGGPFLVKWLLICYNRDPVSIYWKAGQHSAYDLDGKHLLRWKSGKWMTSVKI